MDMRIVGFQKSGRDILAWMSDPLNPCRRSSLQFLPPCSPEPQSVEYLCPLRMRHWPMSISIIRTSGRRSKRNVVSPYAHCLMSSRRTPSSPSGHRRLNIGESFAFGMR